jgi:hypothetical protein
MKMLQLAPLNRVPFGKFNRASASPSVRGREERVNYKKIISVPYISKIPCSDST